jgi:hypothetical protein
MRRLTTDEHDRNSQGARPDNTTFASNCAASLQGITWYGSQSRCGMLQPVLAIANATGQWPEAEAEWVHAIW